MAETESQIRFELKKGKEYTFLFSDSNATGVLLDLDFDKGVMYLLPSLQYNADGSAYLESKHPDQIGLGRLNPSCRVIPRRTGYTKSRVVEDNKKGLASKIGFQH
jgi:hypothetical protein